LFVLFMGLKSMPIFIFCRFYRQNLHKYEEVCLHFLGVDNLFRIKQQIQKIKMIDPVLAIAIRV
jgi:hypothetical protein